MRIAARLLRPLVLAVFVLATLGGGHAHASEKVGPMTRLARNTGKALGYAAGMVVTSALALSKKWNASMLDKSGKPVTLKLGNFDFTLRVRHAAVLGPKIIASSERMQTRTGLQRFGHSFVLGFGVGATVAPRQEGKLEGKLLSQLHRL